MTESAKVAVDDKPSDVMLTSVLDTQVLAEGGVPGVKGGTVMLTRARATERSLPRSRGRQRSLQASFQGIRRVFLHIETHRSTVSLTTMTKKTQSVLKADAAGLETLRAAMSAKNPTDALRVLIGVAAEEAAAERAGTPSAWLDRVRVARQRLDADRLARASQ